MPPQRAAGAGKAGEGVAGGVNKHFLNGAGHPLAGFASAAPNRIEHNERQQSDGHRH